MLDARPESSRWNELLNVKKNLRFSDLAIFLPKAWWRRQTLIRFISTHAHIAWVGKHFPWRLDRWGLFITSVMDTCVCVCMYIFIYYIFIYSSLLCPWLPFSYCHLKLFFCGLWQWKTRSLNALLLHEHWIDSLCGFQRPFRKEMKTRWELVMKTEAVFISRNAFLPLFY